jgi:hypothetical protein
MKREGLLVWINYICEPISVCAAHMKMCPFKYGSGTPTDILKKQKESGPLQDRVQLAHMNGLSEGDK